MQPFRLLETERLFIQHRGSSPAPPGTDNDNRRHLLPPFFYMYSAAGLKQMKADVENSGTI
jgi:hypothetical protein